MVAKSKLILLLICGGIGIGLLIRFVVFKKVPIKQVSFIRSDSLSDAALANSRNAKLTLSNGLVIDLATLLAGHEIADGLLKIVCKDSQTIALQRNPKVAFRHTQFYVIKTQRGSQYTIKLLNGDQIALNAASRLELSITSSAETIVALEGEAYINASASHSKPLKLTLPNGQILCSAASAFNVRCYTGEPQNITVFKGAVDLTVDTRHVTISKDQMVAMNGKDISLTRLSSPESSIAWKNNLFLFDHSDIKTVLNEIERWYTVDVFYHPNRPAKHFTFQLSRASTLSDMISCLKSNGMDLSLDRRKIFVQ